MIFLSMKERTATTFRYTLYHEHIEGYLSLRYLLGQTVVESKERVLDSFDRWKGDVPDLESWLAKRTKYEGPDNRHLIALALELDLARREMKPPDFKKHLKNVLENRL